MSLLLIDVGAGPRCVWDRLITELVVGCAACWVSSSSSCTRSAITDIQGLSFRTSLDASRSVRIREMRRGVLALALASVCDAEDGQGEHEMAAISLSGSLGSTERRRRSRSQVLIELYELSADVLLSWVLISSAEGL